MRDARTTVVVPTVGRPSLGLLLRALAEQDVPGPVVVVDDRRPGVAPPADLPLEGTDVLDVRVVGSGGGGPARARNLGWRHARTPYVSFLDDDVLPQPDWTACLAEDLAALPADAVGSTGRIRVPLAADRRPTDSERSTASLETAHWITADLTCRRDALAAVGGFDERFPRAFREDADLALRLGAEHGTIRAGRRTTLHPLRPEDDWLSLRQQAGNADDQLMRAVHGHDWHRRAVAPVGRLAQHIAVTAAAGAAVVGALTGHRRAAAVGAAAWLAGTTQFTAARVLPGPRDPAEVRRMVLTSAAIPAAATWHAVRGLREHRGAPRWRGAPDLVLLDRDGTLVHDVAYNGDPRRVLAKPGAAAALARLRAEGIRTGLVTNQSGVARGLITRDDVDAVNRRVEELLGPFDTVQVCPHGPEDGCACRKPGPAMVLRACAELGVDPAVTVVVGDIGADVQAAEAAGAVGVLVPTAVTRRAEVHAAAHRCADLEHAVDDLLAGRW